MAKRDLKTSSPAALVQREDEIAAPVIVVPADRRATVWLRRRLGRAVVLSYAGALLLPGPGLWLRHTPTPPLGPLLRLPL
ncbi:hypothetical protein ACFV2H_08210 [Streptomyces sp. NPDC059629]|uniref:hypothetical protein n=1 Tax=Streptomyces sp. NPDC059629 TaxID=3346889 RepID=UPI003691B7E8